MANETEIHLLSTYPSREKRLSSFWTESGRQHSAGIIILDIKRPPSRTLRGERLCGEMQPDHGATETESIDFDREDRISNGASLT